MKNALYFIVGAVLGAGTTYFVCKNKYEEKINAELLKGIGKHETVNTENANANEEKPAETTVTAVEEIPVEVKPSEKKKTKASRELVATTTEPYEITEEEYEAGTFKKVSLIYYMPSDVITEYHRGEDPEEVQIKNYSEVIGIDVLASFENTDAQFLYVRNENTKTDYEIMPSAKVWKKPRKNVAAEPVDELSE